MLLRVLKSLLLSLPLPFFSISEIVIIAIDDVWVGVDSNLVTLGIMVSVFRAVTLEIFANKKKIYKMTLGRAVIKL